MRSGWNESAQHFLQHRGSAGVVEKYRHEYRHDSTRRDGAYFRSMVPTWSKEVERSKGGGGVGKVKDYRARGVVAVGFEMHNALR